MRSRLIPQPTLALSVIAIGVLAAPPTRAGVEYVTRVGSCQVVDRIGDGKDLSIMAGQNMRFEVWGAGIDVNPGVSGDDSTVNARIIAGSARGGPQNLVGPCRAATGSVQVEVDAPANTTQVLQRTLRFRMPLGDTSPLQIRIVPFPQPQWRFTGFQETPHHCLTRGLTPIVKDQQDTRIVITLPPGAAQDTSNCQLRLFTSLSFGSVPEIDIQRDFNLSLSGLPNFLAPAAQALGMRAYSWLPTSSLTLEANMAALRAINSTRNVTLTVAMPNGRSDTLTVQVNPPSVSNAFAQAVVCRNPSTGTTVNAGDAFNCELRLAQAPTQPQPVTFEAIDRLCFAAGSPAVNYNNVTGVGTFNAQPGSTYYEIPLRSVGGNGSTGQPCASQTGVSHLLKFWLGTRDTESGPDFSQTTVRLRALQ
ncbi:MAG: hypothetical protein N2688_04300 [Burkholderiaceae bacterium]|nr:hypothetical protein [Burkholderiaceae bacterium]